MTKVRQFTEGELMSTKIDQNPVNNTNNEIIQVDSNSEFTKVGCS